MEWIVVLEGSGRTAELLAGEPLDTRLTIDADDPQQFHLTVRDPEGDAEGVDLSHAAQARIDALVQEINSFGKLRWGRSYEGLEITHFVSLDEEGNENRRLHLGAASGHL